MRRDRRRIDGALNFAVGAPGRYAGYARSRDVIAVTDATIGLVIEAIAKTVSLVIGCSDSISRNSKSMDSFVADSAITGDQSDKPGDLFFFDLLSHELVETGNDSRAYASVQSLIENRRFISRCGSRDQEKKRQRKVFA